MATYNDPSLTYGQSGVTYDGTGSGGGGGGSGTIDGGPCDCCEPGSSSSVERFTTMDAGLCCDPLTIPTSIVLTVLSSTCTAGPLALGAAYALPLVCSSLPIGGGTFAVYAHNWGVQESGAAGSCEWLVAVLWCENAGLGINRLTWSVYYTSDDPTDCSALPTPACDFPALANYATGDPASCDMADALPVDTDARHLQHVLPDPDADLGCAAFGNMDVLLEIASGV